jgi:hypothetical protein
MKLTIGTERDTGIIGMRPAVTCLANGSIVIVADCDNQKRIVVGQERQDGVFIQATLGTSSKDAGGGKFNASRLYVPSIASGPMGWVASWRNGVKEWGRDYGPGAANGDLSLFLGKGFTTGAARMAYDPKAKRFVLLSKDGAFLELAQDLSIVGRGTLRVGKSGEKLAFVIGANGIRHSAMGGCQAGPSAYIDSTMSKAVVWASARAYPEQGDDVQGYVGIGLLGPRKAIVGGIYAGGLRVNVIKAGKVLRNPESLPSLGSASKQERCKSRRLRWRPGKCRRLR